MSDKLFLIKKSKGNRNYYLTHENNDLIFIKNIKVRNNRQVSPGKKTAKIRVFKLILENSNFLPDEADLNVLYDLVQEMKKNE